MRLLFLVLFAGIFSASLAQGDTQPKEEPEKPGQPPPEAEPEALPGKLFLAIDPGRHTSFIKKVVFTPDSQYLLIVSADGAIAVWDFQANVRVQVLRVPGGAVPSCLAVSPDGHTVAAGFRNREDGKFVHLIALLSLEDGQVVRLLRGHTAPIPALAFTADGKRLVSSGGDKTLRVWDLTDKDKPEQVIKTEKVVAGLALNPNGRRVAEAVSDDDTATIRDLTTGKATASLKGAKAITWYGGESIIAWSSDGKTLATAGEDGIRLWEPNGKLRHHLLGFKDHALFGNVAFGPNGHKLIATDGPKNRVVILDVTTGKEEKSFPATEARRCVFSPDGELVATVGWSDVVFDGKVDVVYDVAVWHANNGKLLWRVKSPGWLNGADIEAGWSADGKTVSWRRIANPAAHKKQAPAFDLTELKFADQPLGGPKLRGPAMKLGPLTLKQLNNARVEVQKDGKRQAVLKLPGNFRFANYLVKHPMTLVAKERAVLLPGFSAHVFNAETGEFQATLWHGRAPVSAAGSPDGRYLVTLATDQVLRVWNLETNKVLLSLFVMGPDWVVWTREGYYAASPGGEKLMGWVVDTGVAEAPTFHPASRFRARLYRPDIIKLLLQEGSTEKAQHAADLARGEVTKAVEVAQVLPPRITVTTSAKPGTVLKDGKLKIDAEATAVGEDPITGLQLLIDGRPYTGEKGQITLDKPEKGPVKASWEVTVPPGPHEVRVLARTGASLGTSRGMGVLAAEDQPGMKKEPPALYVLAFGIDGYADTGLKLGGAVNDATKLEKVFEKYSSALFSKVEAKVLLDKDANKAGMLKGFDWLKERMTTRDLAIIFYAGHGALEKKEFYLLPQDVEPKNLAGTGLSRTEIKKRLQGMPGRIMLVLDACHSAAIGVMFDDLSRDLVDEDCGVVVMCAASPKEVALEKGGHGNLTRSIMEGLSGKASTSKRDHCVYLHHLQQFIIDNVEELSNDTQHPTVLIPPWMRPFSLSKP
jgi:WD40 repeat protein